MTHDLLALGILLGRRSGRTLASRELWAGLTTGARCVDGWSMVLFVAGGVVDASPMRGRVAVIDAGASCVIRHRRWRWR